MIESGFAIILSTPLPTLLVFFWYFFIFELPRYTFPTLAVAAQALSPQRFSAVPAHLPVSVLVVGMSEPEGLRRTICSLREQTREPTFEQTRRPLQVVVVEDGAHSPMSKIAKDFQRRGLIDQYLSTGLRGGKAAALNLGFQHCKHELLIVLDIDSSLDCDAIEKILARLCSDPNIGAVAGNLGVRNPAESVWTRFQSLEYLTSISLARQFLAMFGLLTIVSGAFGAFRRSAIEHVGVWDVGPGDDSNLTLKLRRAGWRIDFEPHAWCLTDAPVSYAGLYRQRLRWNRSLIRNRWRKFSNVFDPQSANFSWRDVLASGNQLFFNFILTISYVVYLVYLIATFGSAAWAFFIGIHLLMLITDIVRFVIAGRLIGRPGVWRLTPYVLGWSLFQGLVMRFNRLHAYLSELLFRNSYRDSFYPQKVRDQQEQF